MKDRPALPSCPNSVVNWCPSPPPPLPALLQLAMKMSVEAISFSAHADFSQTSEFLDILKPPHVVLVHGEKGEMAKLGKELESRGRAQGLDRKIYMPAVGQSVLLQHQAERTAKVVGRLAEKGPAEVRPLQQREEGGPCSGPRRGPHCLSSISMQGRYMKGVLVRKGAQDLLLHPDDLATYTKLKTCAVKHRQMIPIGHRPFSDIRLALEASFEGVARASAMWGGTQ